MSRFIKSDCSNVIEYENKNGDKFKFILDGIDIVDYSEKDTRVDTIRIIVIGENGKVYTAVASVETLFCRNV